MITITFAAGRPEGAYALAIPVGTEDTLHDRLGGLDEAARSLAVRAAEAQRFERETGGLAEAFVAEGEVVRRLLIVGLGAAYRWTARSARRCPHRTVLVSARRDW